MRLVSVVAVAVLAFAAGLALRGRSDMERTAAPKAAVLLDGGGVSRPVRLIPVDLGALERRRREPQPAPAPTAPAPVVVAPAVPPTPPAPAPEPPATPDAPRLGSPEATPEITFDSDG
jgi:hypothetical protein